MTERPTPPSHFVIARWWIRNQPLDAASFVYDIGEPSCFACQWYDQTESPRETLVKTWQRAGLERAHIVPHSLGGSNHPSNYVLICKPCHRAAPDWRDPAEMLAWVNRREPWNRRVVREFQAAWEEVRPGTAMPVGVTADQIFAELDRSGSTHFGEGLSHATVAVAVARAAGIPA